VDLVCGAIDIVIEGYELLSSLFTTEARRHGREMENRVIG